MCLPTWNAWYAQPGAHEVRPYAMVADVHVGHCVGADRCVCPHGTHGDAQPGEHEVRPYRIDDYAVCSMWVHNRAHTNRPTDP